MIIKYYKVNYILDYKRCIKYDGALNCLKQPFGIKDYKRKILCHWSLKLKIIILFIDLLKLEKFLT